MRCAALSTADTIFRHFNTSPLCIIYPLAGPSTAPRGHANTSLTPGGCKGQRRPRTGPGACVPRAPQKVQGPSVRPVALGGRVRGRCRVGQPDQPYSPTALQTSPLHQPSRPVPGASLPDQPDRPAAAADPRPAPLPSHPLLGSRWTLPNGLPAGLPSGWPARTPRVCLPAR